MALGLGNTYDVSVKFLADLESYIQGIEKGSKKIEQFGMRVQKVGKNLTRNLTLPIIALGAATVNASLKMNKAMSNVATLIPDATERVEELKKEVQDLAVETGKATGEMSEGLYEVISAFGDTEETMARVKANARLAVAGFSSITEAVNFTSAATKGYGDISAEAIQKASDLGLLTVRLGKTTFPALAGSIGRLTGSAKALNIPLEELMAIYATLTGVTGDTTRVTTQADAAMRAFMKPIPGMTEAIKELGFAGSEALIGEMGLVGALRAVLETTDGSVEAVGKLVESTEAFPLIFALAGAQADVFDSKLMQMNDSLGTTDEAFDAATKGINAAGHTWDKFKVKLQVMAERLGDTLIPAFTKLLNDLLIPFLNKVGEWIKKFTELDPWMQKTILGVIALTAAIGPLLVGIGNLIKSLVILRLALIGPLGIVAAITAAAALIGALVGQYMSWKARNKEVHDSMRQLNIELNESNKRVRTLTDSADETSDAISELSKATDKSEEAFSDATTAVIDYMGEHPGLRDELGWTVDESGFLIDANGTMIDTFDDLQTAVDSFSMAGIRNEYRATTMALLTELGNLADIYNENRSLWKVFLDWTSGERKELEADIEGLGRRIELYSKLFIESLETVSTGVVVPDEDEEKKRKRKLDGDGGDEKDIDTSRRDLRLSLKIDELDEAFASAIEGAEFRKSVKAIADVWTPKRSSRAYEDWMKLNRQTQEIVSELGYPWMAAEYYAAQGYTAEDLKALGMVFPGDEGSERAPPSEVALSFATKAAANARKTSNIIKNMFMSISDTIAASARLLGKSIVSGDIASALTNIFLLIGNAISKEISAMVTAQIGGGGMFGSIMGAFTGGVVSGLFGLVGGLFSGGSDRGSDASKPIYTMAFITNWEDYFKFGTTLPTSFVYSGRVGDYNVDPHGRTSTGWSTGQHFDA